MPKIMIDLPDEVNKILKRRAAENRTFTYSVPATIHFSVRRSINNNI